MSNTDILFFQAGYSPTDDVQLTLSFIPPLGELKVLPMDLTIKAKVLEAKRVKVAMLGSATGAVGKGDINGFLGRAGAVVQLCTNADCSSSFNSGVHAMFLGPATVLAASNAYVWHAGAWFEFLTEVAWVQPFADVAGELHGAILSFGGRLPRKTWALDFSIVKPLTAPGAAPLLAFTWRIPE